MHFNVAGKIVKLMKSHMSNDKLVLKSIGIQLHYNMYMQINMSEGLDLFLSICLLDVTLSLHSLVSSNMYTCKLYFKYNVKKRTKFNISHYWN